MNRRIKLPFPAVSASVSCMDFGHMQEQIEAVEASGVAFFHYDVVDGKFNRCYMLGDALCKYIHAHSRLAIEVHLAVMDAQPYIEAFAAAGASYLAVHVEAFASIGEVEAAFAAIRRLGVYPVLAYRAETAPGQEFLRLAEQAAWILKLTVHPGFSGQKIQPQAVRHIRAMARALQEANLSVRIQADGNVNAATLPALSLAGASIFTGGTSGLFTAGGSVQQNLARLLESIEKP